MQPKPNIFVFSALLTMFVVHCGGAPTTESDVFDGSPSDLGTDLSTADIHNESTVPSDTTDTHPTDHTTIDENEPDTNVLDLVVPETSDTDIPTIDGDDIVFDTFDDNTADITDTPPVEELPDCNREEVCDGVDNNCNGSIDEGFGTLECGLGECRQVVSLCINGQLQTCTPLSSHTEICDGLDNDCDGQTDEDLGQTTCGVGACAQTIHNCVLGIPQTCVASSPQPEICDGIDNDCDLSVDEELGTISCGVGQCRHTVQLCVNGSSQNMSAVESITRIMQQSR